MKSIVLQFENRQAYRDAVLDDLARGGVFVETRSDLELGEPVQLYLCLPEIPEGIPVVGRVVWRRSPTRWRSALPPGVGVEFDESENDKVHFMNNLCRQRVSSRRVRSRRVQTDFRVDFLAGGRWNEARALNISKEGLFILTDVELGPETPVTMKLFLHGGAPDLYMGRVAWRCAKRPETGLGVEFSFRSPARRRKIREFIEEQGGGDGAEEIDVARSDRRFISFT